MKKRIDPLAIEEHEECWVVMKIHRLDDARLLAFARDKRNIKRLRNTARVMLVERAERNG